MDAQYEKLGVFYLGKEYDLTKDELQQESPTLLRSKDFTTHAVCLGMTGSGKTGLCVSLMEEAAIDGIPVLAIDPKGDISNLLLTFENMTASEFQPWLTESEANEKGTTVEKLAEDKAELWSKGIQSWQQSTDRIKKLKEQVDLRVYTPGEDAGIRLSLYGNLKAPKEEVIEDASIFSDLIESTASSYLTLVDKKEAEAGSPSHSYLSEIFKSFWSKKESITFEQLIRAVQNPPFEQIGIMDLETFFPKKERSALALKFNALYASPQFKEWSKGEALSIPKLLFGKSGKPQVSILSIAHLNEEERIFFVSKVLSEFVSWTRKQSGTSSLRALLYMDEIYGYFPPTANPPTKKPMLTLLKQARAHGVGCVLATQNPVDLDYKGLSNTGTWFIGRLQTQRDKDRLIEGLKSIGGDIKIDLDKAISSLKKRVFLLHSVHRKNIEFFHTRWALSFLSGPLGLGQIKKLMAPFKNQAAEKSADAKEETEKSSAASSAFSPQSLAREISQKLLPNESEKYRACFAACTSVMFSHSKSGQEKEVEQYWFSATEDQKDFEETSYKEQDLFEIEKGKEAEFLEPPAFVQNEKTFSKMDKEVQNEVYRELRLTLYKCPMAKEYSQFGEKEEEFRGRMAHLLRERKDEEIDALNSKYEKKIDMVEKRIMRAEQKVEKEQAQYSQKKNNAFLGAGIAIASIFLGGKAMSASSARRAGSVFKSVGTASKEKGDIARAEEQLKDYQEDLEKLQVELEDEILEIESKYDAKALEIKEETVKPLKSNIQIKWTGIVWK